MSDTDIQKARDEVDKEFEQFRQRYGLVLEAVERINAAGPLDDIHDLLERLEDVVKEVRTGGAIGSGAKGHRSALEKYRKLTETA